MTDDASKPRRLPRFSLRSLILFVLLAGSGYGLWVRWEPWHVRNIIQDAQEVPLGAKGGGDGALLAGGRVALFTAWKVTINGGCGNRESVVELKDSGHVEPRDIQGLALWYRTEKEEMIVAIAYPRLHVVEEHAKQWRHILISRRRPECLYGVAWLPEFWLTVVLGIGLVVSLWRDRRSLKKAA